MLHASMPSLFAMLLQGLYNALPYALSPVLGNPLAMAAVNVDRTASLPTQVSCLDHRLQRVFICSSPAQMSVCYDECTPTLYKL